MVMMYTYRAIHESPLWLMIKGKNKRAREILALMKAVNSLEKLQVDMIIYQCKQKIGKRRRR